MRTVPTLSRLTRERINVASAVLLAAAIFAVVGSFAISKTVPKTAAADTEQRAAILAAAQAPGSPDRVIVLTGTPKLAAICRPAGRRPLLLAEASHRWRVLRTRPRPARPLHIACGS
jgi:hypothetical protein